MRPERITTGNPLHAEDSAHGRTEGSHERMVGASGQERLEYLTEKVARGEGLTMAERLERQGIIFGHAGRMPSRNDHWKNPMAADRRKANQEASARCSNAKLRDAGESGVEQY